MKLIQIGMGGMGNAWIQAAQQLDAVAYAAFVEIDDDIAAQQCEAYNFSPGMVYKTLGAALAAVEADGVLDITPPAFRKENALTALRAGLPTLCEKPLSDTRADAQAIVDEANRCGVLYAVAQNYRYRAVIQTLKQLLDARTYGEIGSVTLNFYKGLWHDGFRNTMPYPLTIDMSIHHYDLMRFLLGAEPIAISAHSWNPPSSTYVHDAAAAVFLQFANGIRVNYTGSWVSYGMETDWNGDWRVDCAGGVIWMTQGELAVQTVRQQDPRFGYQYNEVEAIPLQEIPYENQVYMLDEFYRAVMRGERLITTCQDNIHSLNMVFDTIQSIEQKQTIYMGEPA